MNVEWNTLPRTAWDAFHAARPAPLQQSWAYGDALAALGVRIERAALHVDGQLAGVAQFIVRRVAGYLALASCGHGPVWAAQLPAAQRAEGYRLLRRSLPVRPLRIALFSPDTTLEAAREETRGLWRVMTGTSTVRIDLQQPEPALRAALDGKWRNRLVKAQADARLDVRCNADRAACERLLAHEQAQRAARRFHGLPTAFVPAFLQASAPGPGFLVASARIDRALEAGMLFLLHGRAATYHVGWSGEAGRSANAHNRLLWEAMCTLRDRGIAELDLGGVNGDDLPGITRFKLGTGGRLLTFAGTFHR